MLTRRRLHAQRGQALVESALFMPLLVLSLVALLFFSRLGVVAERAETAARYANLVAFRQGETYTVATVYDLLGEVLNPTSNELGPLCLTPNATGAPQPGNTIGQAAASALVQSQPAVTPSLPPARRFWQSDGTVVPSCNPLSLQLSSGTYGVSNLPLSITSFSVQGQINAPPVIANIVGTNVSSTTANIAFLNVAAPNLLVACVPGMSVALTVIANLTPATPNCNATNVTIP